MSTNERPLTNGQPGKRLSNISEERSTPTSTPPQTKRMAAGVSGPSVANGRVPSSPTPKAYAGSYEPSLTVNIRNIEADVVYGAVGDTHMCLKVLKLVLSLLIGILVLGCITVSRLSLIGITKTIRNKSSIWDETDFVNNCSGDFTNFTNSKKVKDMESTVVMVEYILMFPYGVSFFRSVWNGAFQASMPWPHVKAALLGVVLSFLEVFGLCLFTLRVMPSVAPSISLVLANGIFFVPIILQVVKHSIKLSKVRIRKHLGLFFYILASIILGLACGALVGAWCYYRTQLWEIPVSLLSLSVAWAPLLQEYQTGEGSDTDDTENAARSKKKSRAHDVAVEDPDGIFFGRQKSEVVVQTVDHLGSNVKQNARWKAGIINNFFKIVFVLLVPEALKMLGLVKICSPWAWTKLDLYATFTISNPAITSFIVNVCCSFGGYVLAWMACTIRMQFFGFALPLCIGTNVACLLLIQFLSTTWFVMRSPTIVMEREASLFWLPGYSGVFPEQWLLLSRKNRNTKSEDFVVQKRTRQNAHVYICTTMYHEAEHEMEQLLTSLRGVAESQVGERTFESHIFFDGGCKQGQPSQWALQLLSLMDHTLKDGNTKESIINQCTKYKTPYGLQLHWDLHYDNGETESGMSFNIHLKDNTLVKNKKRWSQVMYMSYILDYAVYFSPIGVESKAIEDTHMKATSVLGQDSFNGPHRARLHMKRDASGAGGWTAGEFDDDQYLQIDLGEDMVFTGVVTQGKAGTNEWVTKYRLLYSDDGELWQYYKDDSGQPVEFEGNRDADTPVRQLLDKPITTRFVSFNPVQWANRISMRVEVLGYSAADKDRDNFMLATDADVKFSPQSAKALLDIMTRDPNVGAVCARTHPLGSGPMVWYQMFDYAVGHWFQKVANSVLGTVLCCPGCFSVYRAKAVRDALPTYATKVTKAEEFLTKDMGEDRWFCTLLVEKGWRLEYTAVSEDSTYCPEEFDEFFNQRRRWIPSTIANQMELLRKWANGQMINDYISRLFILYQGFLLFSTMIGPSTVIMIIAAGLELVVGNIGGSIIPTVVILFLVFVAYALLCVYTTQETQLKWAKILTMLFTVVMVIVLIGQAREMVTSFQILDRRLHAESSVPAPNEDVKSCQECERTGECTPCKDLDCTSPLEWTPGNVTAWISDCITDLGTFDNISKHFGRYDGFQLSLATESELCDEFDGPNGDFDLERDCKIIFTQFQHRVQNAANAPTPSAPPTILQQLPLPISVIYFLGLAGLYVITALLHPSEFMTLIYGFVYLLSLPSGYILLIIYSVCNMTDRSWGDVVLPPEDGHINLAFEEDEDSEIFDDLDDDGAKEPRHVAGPSERRIGRQKSRGRGRKGSVSSSNWGSWGSRKSHSPSRPSIFSVALAASKGGKSFSRWRAGSLNRSSSQTFVKDVSDWLPYYWPPKLKKKYEKKFRENGFENTTFISGMSDKDLQAIGIKNDFHRDILMKEIKKLTEFELPGDVPDNCREWLYSIGLDQYIKNFENYGIYSKNDMASLRSMDITELLKDLKITKMAHINRISNAISRMRSPDESDRRISQVKSVISKDVKTRVMQQDDGRTREFKFWDTLRRECLDPDIALFSSDGDLRGKLVELRNMWLGVLLIVNVLWITIVVSLTYIPELRLWDANPLSLLSLLVFGLLQLIQFLAMLYHRLRTLLHYIARLPYPLKVRAIKNIGSSKAEIKIEEDKGPGVNDPMPSAGDLLTRRPTILGGDRRKGPTTFKTNPLFDNSEE
ncbi:PREDICTED: uncharacterized protein LOC109468914 [Branchiostoma belcheri]|uniref:chitin synthase n=1 Tax=Branchiostoma belcheri TaxID=7741 RepID=A0A6P4YMC2_BRABE|nr:PREDICTED: uncharacterized protein LOC109468914 [Branchiostoma belcheri]